MKKWMPLILTVGVMGLCMASGFAAEEGSGPKQPASLLENMKEAGFMEYILLFVSIAGLALMLQAVVTLRAQQFCSVQFLRRFQSLRGWPRPNEHFEPQRRKPWLRRVTLKINNCGIRPLRSTNRRSTSIRRSPSRPTFAGLTRRNLIQVGVPAPEPDNRSTTISQMRRTGTARFSTSFHRMIHAIWKLSGFLAVNKLPSDEDRAYRGAIG